MQLLDALIGQTVAERFLVLEQLGSGGFAAVYKAQHTRLNNLVAIKVLHLHLLAKPDIVERFEREAEALSQLQHSAIANVHDIGHLPDGRPYIVMEYLAGKTLADIIDGEGAQAAERVLPLFVECCDALRYAHRRGVLHRDLKPDNIFVTRDPDGVEHAKLLDFGLAKVLFGASGGANTPSRLTVSGVALGTPWYMSPEQCQALPLDGRSDVYTLAYCLFETLAGERPFPGNTQYEAMDSHLHAPVPELVADGVGKPISPQLNAALRRALAKSPDARFANAEEFRDALRGTVSGVMVVPSFADGFSSGGTFGAAAQELPLAARKGFSLGALFAVSSLVLMLSVAVGYDAWQADALNFDGGLISAHLPASVGRYPSKDQHLKQGGIANHSFVDSAKSSLSTAHPTLTLGATTLSATDAPSTSTTFAAAPVKTPLSPKLSTVSSPTANSSVPTNESSKVATPPISNEVLRKLVDEELRRRELSNKTAGSKEPDSTEPKPTAVENSSDALPPLAPAIRKSADQSSYMSNPGNQNDSHPHFGPPDFWRSRDRMPPPDWRDGRMPPPPGFHPPGPPPWEQH